MYKMSLDSTGSDVKEKIRINCDSTISTIIAANNELGADSVKMLLL